MSNAIVPLSFIRAVLCSSREELDVAARLSAYAGSIHTNAPAHQAQISLNPPAPDPALFAATPLPLLAQMSLPPPTAGFENEPNSAKGSLALGADEVAAAGVDDALPQIELDDAVVVDDEAHGSCGSACDGVAMEGAAENPPKSPKEEEEASPAECWTGCEGGAPQPAGSAPPPVAREGGGCAPNDSPARPVVTPPSPPAPPPNEGCWAC